MLRRYHSAPPDYGIVEEFTDTYHNPVYVIYFQGREITRSESLSLAWTIVDAHIAARNRMEAMVQ